VKLPIDLLRSFLAVYRAGSVTAGADLLGLTQPTVTAQVRALESALGRPLFDRHARGVTPTAVADHLAQRIAEPLDSLEAIVLEQTPGPALAAVHLGGPAEFVSERALPALADMIGNGLRLRVTFGMPDDLLDGLLAGRLDLAITTQRPRRTGLSVTPLCDEQFILVAAPAWADRVTAPVSPETMSRVPLIAYADNAPILRRYWRTVFGTRLARTPDLVVPDLRSVLAAALAQAGASVLPSYLTTPHLAAGTLRSLAQPPVPPLNTLFLAHRPAAIGQRAIAAARARLLQQSAAW
jgi:DNA-binding transcriptional LysR family regulator